MSEPMPAEVEDLLRQVDDEFRAQPEEPGRVPDGDYEGTVVATRVFRGRQDATAVFAAIDWALDGADGAKVDQVLSLNASGSRMGFTKRVLRELGYTGETVSEVPEWLDSLPGLRAHLHIATKGRYQNVFVDSLLDADGPRTADDLPAEVPF